MNQLKSFDSLASIDKQTIKIIRLPQVKNLTGYSRSSIYLKISEGSFPPPISLGARAVGWVESEVLAWIEERIKHSRQEVISK